ncbi:MAG: phage virion morphogenesis protein [Alcaligenaceae bacterium]|nr:phage virion morphogenesis protein [Alcaligenaceae bacterium]
MSDFSELDDWLQLLLSRLSAPQRLRVNRLVAQRLRQIQRDRIAAQKNPDGTAFAPRAPALRQRSGAIARRGTMFKKLRTARHMKIKATSDELSVGFSGRSGVIAAIHHYGESRSAGRGRKYQTPSRRLLGFASSDLAEIADIYLLAISTLESS